MRFFKPTFSGLNVDVDVYRIFHIRHSKLDVNLPKIRPHSPLGAKYDLGECFFFFECDV